ncbi:MAG: hypothetical protein AB2801_14500 [Candidatus Thiodiazotropha endolucinida]
MSIFEWTLIHALIALFWLWILIWGGAKKLEGWGAFFLIDWLAARLDKEQLRLYALLSLVIQVIWYVIGNRPAITSSQPPPSYAVAVH